MSEVTWTIRRADWSEKVDRDALLSIRYDVFVEEQGVPEEIESDSGDAIAWHWLVEEVDGEAVATARLLQFAPGVGKVGRVAVREAWRRQGIASALLHEMIAEAKRQDFTELILHGQVSSEAFYESLEFVIEGAVFEEAGIPHRLMKRTI